MLALRDTYVRTRPWAALSPWMVLLIVQTLTVHYLPVSFEASGYSQVRKNRASSGIATQVKTTTVIPIPIAEANQGISPRTWEPMSKPIALLVT